MTNKPISEILGESKSELIKLSTELIEVDRAPQSDIAIGLTEQTVSNYIDRMFELAEENPLKVILALMQAESDQAGDREKMIDYHQAAINLNYALDIIKARYGNRPLKELLSMGSENGELGVDVHEVLKYIADYSLKRVINAKDSDSFESLTTITLPEGKARKILENRIYRNKSIKAFYLELLLASLELMDDGYLSLEDVNKYSEPFLKLEMSPALLPASTNDNTRYYNLDIFNIGDEPRAPRRIVAIFRRNAFEAIIRMLQTKSEPGHIDLYTVHQLSENNLNQVSPESHRRMAQVLVNDIIKRVPLNNRGEYLTFLHFGAFDTVGSLDRLGRAIIMQLISAIPYDGPISQPDQLPANGSDGDWWHNWQDIESKYR